MPTTEVPNSPSPEPTQHDLSQPDPRQQGPNREGEPDREPARETAFLPRRNNLSYGDLGTDELVQRINELEDERRAARIREGIWVALLLHAAILLLWAFGPRYILHEPRVINPADALRDRKDLAYLDLPPDALKQLKPKNPTVLSDKDRVQQSQHPTLDRKTLEQLRAMKPAGPPAQTAAPSPPPQAPQAQEMQQPAAPQPQPTPPPQTQPQQAQQTPPTPSPFQPVPRQQAQQSPSQSNPFKTNSAPGDFVRQAARNAANSQSSGDYGQNAPPVHGGMQAGVDILSDTQGYNFAPYLQRVVQATYRAWLPIIPISARPPLDDKGKVYISFHIGADGSVKGMNLDGGSGEVALDRAAWAGIVGAGYPPLPADFKGKDLWLRFGFYYNIDPALEK